MKTTSFIITAAAALITLSSCEKKETTVREEVSDKVGDALDTRPNEELRDAAENIEKDVKKAGEGLGETLKEVGKDIQNGADKAEIEMKKAGDKIQNAVNEADE